MDAKSTIEKVSHTWARYASAASSTRSATTATGQRLEETTEYTKDDEARDLLKKREGAIADGIPITATSTRFTFDDAVKDVVTDYTVNGKKSQANLERRIKLHLTPFFGGKLLRNIEWNKP